MISGVRALAFDVFGTVVDWRGSVSKEIENLGLPVNATEFADAWRAGYGPAMARVTSGDLPWMNIDELHRMILDDLLGRSQIETLSEREKDELNRAWHRLAAWPDSVAGLMRLKEKFVLVTLSNGNVSLLINMAKNARLPWDCILSAELVKTYKPASEVYLMAAHYLGFNASEIMMVAAHPGDLKAAATVGMRTAFVERPDEYGQGGTQVGTPPSEFDVSAIDFEDLAHKLGV
jgi:2-haloacid dehalogenase